jgi:hypothetical protein
VAHLAGYLAQAVVAFAESDVLTVPTATTLQETTVEETALERLVLVAVDETHAGRMVEFIRRH